jgi:hypothetical protein
MAQSTFLFRFRLQPWYLCQNIYFDSWGEEASPFVCMRDLLNVCLLAEHTEIGALLMRAKLLATTLIDVHAYYSFPLGPALDVTSESWVEMKTVAERAPVIGYSDPSLVGLPLHRDHPDNQPFKQGAALLWRALETPGLGVCLQDFRAAQRATTAYAPFFAFRVIEDIGLSFSKSGASEPAWERMNEALGTTKTHWQRLTKARQVAAHEGPLADQNPDTPDRNELLTLAHNGVERWLAYLEAREPSHGPPPISAIATVSGKRATNVSGWTP